MIMCLTDPVSDYIPSLREKNILKFSDKPIVKLVVLVRLPKLNLWHKRIAQVQTDGNR